MQRLKEQLSEGRYPPGSWLPTERELAAEFGVSRPVVRATLAALQDEGLIAREPGCRPTVQGAPLTGAAASESARAALRSLAVVLPQRPTIVSAHAILCGINDCLRDQEAPCRALVLDTYDTEARPDSGRACTSERSVLESLQPAGLAGVILWHRTGGAGIESLQRIQSSGIPLVLIDRSPPELECDYVGVENARGMRLAVDHLVALGHRRIGYVTTTERISTLEERESGFRSGLSARGIAPDPDLLFRTPMEITSDMGPAARHLLTLREPPTAVVADNDLHAFEFIREAEKLGRRVPDDLSVVGFDDIESYSPHTGILTTVHQPFYDVGHRAAELALRRLADSAPMTPRTFRHVTLPTSLVVRSTSRPI